MATVPFWFDANAYLVNKAAQLGLQDALAAREAFLKAGWPVDSESLYSHFTQFGNAEKVSPNSWFNNSDYLYNKAASYYGTSQVTPDQAKSMDLAFNQAGFSPWAHFQLFWDENYGKNGTFHNPSSSFDVAKYMNDKLAQIQKAEPDKGWTMNDLVKAFKDAGLDPVSHYIVSGQYENLKPQAVTTGTPGKNYELTGSDDHMFGTTGDDYFHSNIGTLDDDDYIDGGAGNDTLYAIIKGSTDEGVQPTITNVENVTFHVQTDSTTSGGGHNLPDAYIDAGNISGMKVLGNDQSRAGLIVEDVRTYSHEMTIRMTNTDPGDIGFGVCFDTQHLTSKASTSSGDLTLELIDTNGAATNNKPLQDNAYNQVTFHFNGKQYTLKFEVVKGNSTYDDLANAIQVAVDAEPDLVGKIMVKKDGTFTKYDGNTGKQVTGDQIHLISTDQGAFDVDQAAGDGWAATGGLPPKNSLAANMEQTGSESCPLISTNVELDNVGRIKWDDASPCLPDNSILGSKAGDLMIGAMGDRGGIERFDVTVDRGSWLSSLSSTNETLRMVTVTNGDINKDGKATGNLFIGDRLNPDGSAPAADLTSWTAAPRLLSTTGLEDVKLFDASAMQGKVNIGASFTETSLDKYLRDVDGSNTMDSNYAPSGNFSYKFGVNDDTLNMSVHGGVASDRDFKLDIDMGKGNDLVNFAFDFLTANQAIDQTKLNNVTISTGEGKDTVWTWGEERAMNKTLLDQAHVAYDGVAGAITVDGGAGDDAIYVAQDATVDNATWVFNANVTGPYNENPYGVQIGRFGEAQPLENNVASTTDSFTVTGASAGSNELYVTVSFLGVAQTVKVGKFDVATGGTTYTVGSETVNQAIISAISSNAALSKLLQAQDGAGHSLLLQSLIDGRYLLGDLDISFDNVFNNTANNVTGDIGSLTQAAYAGSVQTWTIENITYAQNNVYTVVIDGRELSFTDGATPPTAASVAAGLTAQAGTAELGVTFTAAGNTISITSTSTNNKWINDVTLNGNGFGSADATYDYTAKVEGKDNHYYGNNTIKGGDGNDVLVSGYADATIHGGAGNDTIIAGNYAYVKVTGGSGADYISLGIENHSNVAGAFDSIFQAKGDSGTFSAPTSGSEISTSTFDVINNLTTTGGGIVGDVITFVGYSAGSALGGGSVVTTWAGLMANDEAHVAKGFYDAASGKFILDNTNGLDSILVVDTTVGAGTSYEAIILVGVTGAGTINADGNGITFA